MTTRGIRLNNPCNIRKNDRNVWVGMAPTQLDPAFVTFLTPQFGFRAVAKLWLSYRRIGVTTLAGIVGRWAPEHGDFSPKENDTAAYLADVADRTGFEPHADLDTRDPDTVINLAHAFTWHEQGCFPYPVEIVREGVAMALGDDGTGSTAHQAEHSLGGTH